MIVIKISYKNCQINNQIVYVYACITYSFTENGQGKLGNTQVEEQIITHCNHRASKECCLHGE